MNAYRIHQISLRDIVNFNLTILPTKYPFGICNQRFDNFTTRNSFLKLSTKITYATHEISHRHIVFFNLTIYLPDSPALFGSQSRLEATNQISLQYIVNKPLDNVTTDMPHMYCTQSSNISLVNLRLDLIRLPTKYPFGISSTR